MRESEECTILRGNDVVAKCDPRIEFRGQIDELSAEAVLTCAYAERYGYTNVLLGAQEIVRVMRELTRAEATGEAPNITSILGMTMDELREVSHHPQTELGLPHYVPDESTDLMTAHINVLRTKIRSVERQCCCLEGDWKEMQLILNRLSSAAYILMLESRSERI